MIKTIDGRKYIMRDKRSIKALRFMYNEFIIKFKSKMTFHQWLCNQGKVSLEIND
jgi:hypothetical protein